MIIKMEYAAQIHNNFWWCGKLENQVEVSLNQVVPLKENVNEGRSGNKPALALRKDEREATGRVAQIRLSHFIQ